MRVRILKSMAGPGVFRPANSLHDIEEAEALRLIEAGIAEVAEVKEAPVKKSRRRRKATIEAKETR